MPCLKTTLKKAGSVADRIAPAVFGAGIGLLIVGILIKREIKASILKPFNREKN